MNALPITGELFATNQVSPDTERCYKYQLRNFAEWMRENCDTLAVCLDFLLDCA